MWVLAALAPSISLAQTTIRVPENVTVPYFYSATAADDAVISGNGRYLVFSTSGSDLGFADVNAVADVFRFDRQTSTLALVSIDKNNALPASGSSPKISDDGRYVAFLSSSPTIAAGKSSSTQELILRDMDTQTNSIVCVGLGSAINNTVSEFDMSPDARYFAYLTQASNQVNGDTNGRPDVFVRDRIANTTVFGSLGPGNTLITNGSIAKPLISGNGQFVSFTTTATGLGTTDANSTWDVYRRNLQTGALDRCSVTASGGDSVRGGEGVRLSPNGETVFFTSRSGEMVGSASITLQGYTWKPGNIIEQVTKTRAGAFGTTNIFDLRVSPDGSQLVVTSQASYFVNSGSNGFIQAYVTPVGQTNYILASVKPAGATPAGNATSTSVSNSGLILGMLNSDLAFFSPPSKSALNKAIISIASQGTATLANPAPDTNTVNDVSLNSSISDDGRFVLFESNASNLVTGDTNGVTDIFLYDSVTEATTLVSASKAGVIGNSSSTNPHLSGDGKWAVFTSSANNLGLGGLSSSVILKNLETGDLTVVSKRQNGTGGQGQLPYVSTTGDYVAFTSGEPLLANAGLPAQAYVFSRATGSLEVASLNTSGVASNGTCSSASVSSDGRRVAFQSTGTNFGYADPTGEFDIFLRDRAQGTTICVSADGTNTSRGGQFAIMSGDGRYVGFGSSFKFVTTPASFPLYLYDVDSQTFTGGILEPDGSIVNFSYSSGSLSRTGRYVLFSTSNQVIPGITSGWTRVYSHDRATRITRLVSSKSGGIDVKQGFSDPGGIAANGKASTFDTTAATMFPNRIFTRAVGLHIPLAGPIANVSGNCTLQGWVGPRPNPGLAIRAVDSNGNIVAESGGAIAANGSFTVEIELPAAGNYRLKAYSSTCLQKDLGSFNLTGGSNTNAGSFTLLNGDVTGDNYVGTDDYLQINFAFDSDPSSFRYRAAADLNGDEYVGTDDYLLLNGNFDLSGD